MLEDNIKDSENKKNKEKWILRVLVTGHKGYIGTIMVPMLQAEGFNVTGLDNDLFDGCIFGDQSICGGILDIHYVRKDTETL